MQRTIKEAVIYNQGLCTTSLEYREAQLYCKFGGKLGIIVCSEIAEFGKVNEPIKDKA